MGDILFSNNSSSLLAVTIGTGDTSIQVQAGEGALFPSPSGSQFFQATLEDDSGNIEIVQCTSRSTDVLTVVRAQEGTAAQAFTATITRVELRLTKAQMEGLLQNTGDISVGGDIAVTGTVDTRDVNTDGTKLDGIEDNAKDDQTSIVGITGTRAQFDTAVTDGDISYTDHTHSAATESALGIVERADQAEVDAGTDTTRYVSPATLEAKPGLGIVQIKFKTADEALTNDTTLQDDNHLVGFTLATGGRYIFDAFIAYTGTSTTVDLHWTWIFTNTPQNNWMTVQMGLGIGGQNNGKSAELDDGNTAGTSVNADDGLMIRGMILANATTGGSFKLRWACLGATGTTTLRSGSWARLEKIA